MATMPVPKGTVITSGFKPPHRPSHFGIDLDWSRESGEVPVYAAQGWTPENAHPC